MDETPDTLQVDTDEALKKSPSVRLSDSVQRSPQIVPGLISPVKSVYPDMQGTVDSIGSQSDAALRTIDLFDQRSDDSSPDGAVQLMGLAEHDTMRKRQQSAPSTQILVEQCETRRSSLPLSSWETWSTQKPSGNAEQPTVMHPRLREYAADSVSESPALSSTAMDQQRNGALDFQCDDSVWNDRANAHALAHEITLQSLIRDEGGFGENGLSSLILSRKPTLTPHLHIYDPRSPRDPIFLHRPMPSRQTNAIPPPINTHAATKSFPENIVNTPYPHVPQSIHQKKFGRSPVGVTFESPHPLPESILTLSVRRCNVNSRPRVTTLTIPSPILDGSKRLHKSDGFDDTALFNALRARYRVLVGPSIRYLSARSLSRIVVSGRASRAADAGYGWIHSPRSPRFVAWKGLSDSFSEDKILHHYRHPSIGKSRYAFVQWSHRLASGPEGSQQLGTDEENGADLVRRKEQPEGLEFVVAWSWRRILCVLLWILALSGAALLLWIFLGRNTVLNEDRPGHDGGFRDTGGRVGSGLLLGMGVLLAGLTGMAGWIGISWLVM